MKIDRLVWFRRVKRRDYKTCSFHCISGFPKWNTRNASTISLSYGCKTYFFKISECGYCNILYRALHSSSFIPPPSAERLLLYCLSQRGYLSPICMHPAIVNSEIIKVSFFARKMKSGSFFSAASKPCKLKTVSTVLFQKTRYSCTLIAVHDIWTRAKLCRDLHFSEVRRLSHSSSPLVLSSLLMLFFPAFFQIPHDNSAQKPSFPSRKKFFFLRA